MKSTIVLMVSLVLVAPAWAQDGEDQPQAEAQPQAAEGQPEGDDDTVEEDEPEDTEADHKPEEDEEAEWLSEADVDRIFGEDGIPDGGGLFAPPEEGQRPQRSGAISAKRMKIVEMASGIISVDEKNFDAWARGSRKRPLYLFKGMRWRANPATFGDLLKMMWIDGVKSYRVGDAKRSWKGKLPRYCPYAGRSIRITGDDTICPYNETWWRVSKWPKKAPWCAAFASTLWRAAMGDDMPDVSGHVPTLKRLLEARGLYVPYTAGMTPEPGDILFERSGKQPYAHVGVVIVVFTDGTFWMLEGNVGGGPNPYDRLGLFEYKPTTKRRNRISGFGKPEPPPSE